MLRMLIVVAALALLTAATYAINAAENTAHALFAHPMQTLAEAIASVLASLWHHIR